MMIKDFYPADETHRMNYIVHRPEVTEGLPLIVYLHGAGERGLIADHLYKHGIPKLIKEGTEYPAVILIPQCPAHVIWTNIVEDIKSVIDHVVKDYGILPDRIAITGSSMGGYGTWEMGTTYSNFFSAIAPVAGGGLIWRAKRLKTTPVYAYHGDADTVIPISESERMVAKVIGAGGSASLATLYDLGHNEGIDYAYRNTDLIEKLICARRTDFTRIPESYEEFFY